MKENILGLVHLECNRCLHSWYPRSPKKPKVCPKCKSPYWNKSRKRKLVTIEVIAIMFLLISTVALLPVISAETTIQETDLSKIRIVKNNLIEKLGEERYKEIEENVSRIIDKQFIRIDPIDYDLPLFELLKEIAVLIVATMVLLFGNNPLGLGLGAVSCVLILAIPVLILATGVTFLDLSQLFLTGDWSFDDLIEDFGLIGTIIIGILALPIGIIVLSLALCVAVPIVWVTLMQELIWYATDGP